MLRKLLLLLSFLCLLSSANKLLATCSSGYAQVVVTINPDNFPTETSWSLYDDSTNTRIDSGRATGDTICVPSNHCMRFTIYDSYGDGLCCANGNGSYLVTMNGTTVASGAQFTRFVSTFFNCPQGHDCGNSVPATVSTMVAPAANTWYTFTPDTTGIYVVSTCGLAHCDTKIYIYDHCIGLIYDDNQTGTIFYNDDACGGLQTSISASLIAHTTYYIRVGQYLTACAGDTIPWQIHFNGPVRGCMDTAACTYNPLATASDTSACIYAPSPLCPAPDLALDVPMLKSSMYFDSLNVNNGDCYVGEGCLAGYGKRHILRFSTHIRNIGNQDYFIGAPDTIHHQFVWDPCHQHWHYVGYAEYLLFDDHNNQVQVGFKNGFCVLDLECSGGGIGKYSCGNMGITSGCGDIYSSALACQWIDLTAVDTGNYTLVVRVNWDRSPDKLGHVESRFDNNWGQVCFHYSFDSTGRRHFDTLATCPSYIDCHGDTFGSARMDCRSVCNGSAVRGDLNVNLARDTNDLIRYLDGMTADTLASTVCNDLNGDGRMSVADATRLNGCLRKNNNALTVYTNPQSAQHMCEFPYNVYDPLDSVIFSIADVDWTQHYVDLSVYNPLCKLMGYELRLNGMTIDSVKNLALGNYFPDIRHSASGHITELSNEDQALFKQLAPLNFIRVYFSHLHDSVICLGNVIDVVNQDYQQVLGTIGSGCVVYHAVDTHHIDTTHVGINELAANMELKVIPNPTAGAFELFTTGKSLHGAGVKIFDAVGKLVYENKYNEGLTNKMSFDLSDKAAGVYQLQVNLNGTSITKRFVISRK